MERARIILALGGLVAIVASPAMARGSRRGALLVRSQSAGARVEVDGRFVGVLPLPRPVRLRAGRHTLKVTKPGYMPYQERVVVRAGHTLTRDVMLLAYAGVFTLRSTPSAAEVWVDGKRVGQTPMQAYEIVAGDHRVEVRAEGYQRWRRDLKVMAGQSYHFQVVLEAGPEAGGQAREDLARADASPGESVPAPGGADSASSDVVSVEDVDLSGLVAVDLVGDEATGSESVTVAGPGAVAATSEAAPRSLEAGGSMSPADTAGVPPDEVPPAAEASGSQAAPASALAALPVEPLHPARGSGGPRRPLWRRWWVWAATGAVLAAGLATALAAAPPRPVTECTPVPGVDGHLGLDQCR